MNTDRDNRFLYAVKFIACLFVITIHARIPGTFGDVVMCVARFAVPFFFAVTGRFMLIDKEGNPITETSAIRKRCAGSIIKLLKITSVVYLIHLLFSFAVSMISKVPPAEYFSSKFNLMELRNFLLFNSGKFIYDGTYVFDHLWYLFALIYVYLLIYIFAPMLRSWYKALIVILLFFLYFGELLQTYYPIRPFDISISTWFVMRNWLFVGLPFVLIGILFSDSVSDIRKRDAGSADGFFERLRIPAAASIAFGIILSFLEFTFIDSKEVYFGTLFILAGILFLSESAAGSCDALYILGKRASSNIYYYHVLVIALLDILSSKGLIWQYTALQKPFIVMALCFILFGIWPLVSEKKKIKGNV